MSAEMPGLDDQCLPLLDFDRELGIGELMAVLDRDRTARVLQDILRMPFALLSLRGEVVLGEQVATPLQRAPVRGELEPVAFLLVAGDAGDRLPVACRTLELLLQGAARYLMASSLHLQAVREDYALLLEKHRALEQSEARYRDLAVSLEQRVVEQVRTIEAAQRQLYQTEKMASVGQLAAGVAHEINNPIGFVRSNITTAQSYLNTIVTLLEKIKAGASPDELGKDYRALDLDFVIEDFQVLLRESSAGVGRVAVIVKDLKEFSNVDASETDLADINERIGNVAGIIRRELDDPGRLRLDLGSIPRIRCQPGHISQVVMSMLQNAVKAIANGGDILVRTVADAGMIRVIIRDSGAGMSEEVKNRIFDPFFTTRGVGQGTGLGLTVSRDIIQAHGGNIEVESAPGKGATFTISLPVPE